MLLKGRDVQDQRQRLLAKTGQDLREKMVPNGLDLNALIAEKAYQTSFDTGGFRLADPQQFLGHPLHDDAFCFDGS